MSQYGAHGMALRGASAGRIISFYSGGAQARPATIRVGLLLAGHDPSTGVRPVRAGVRADQGRHRVVLPLGPAGRPAGGGGLERQQHLDPRVLRAGTHLFGEHHVPAIPPRGTFQYLASEPVRKWLAGRNMEIIRHVPSTSRPGGRAAIGRRRPRA